MKFQDLYEKENKEHSAVSSGVQTLPVDQYMGAYKFSKDVAGHDGKKQHSPDTSDSKAYTDKPIVVGYTDLEDKMTKAVLPKTKQTVGAGSEEPSTVQKNSPLSKTKVKEAYQNDESNLYYRYDKSDGRLKQRMVQNNDERQAFAQGFKDTPELALKAAGIIRSKFDPKKFVQNQNGKWVTVYPYGQQGVAEGMPADNDMGSTTGGAKMTLGQWKQMWMKKMPNADFAAMFRSPPNMRGSAIAYFDGWVNNPDARWDPQQGVAEGWKDLAVGGAMALGALGAGHAQAADLSNFNTQYLQQVASGEHPRPMVSIDDAKAELQARANGKQQSVTTPAKSEEPKGFSKEYLQKAADPNRFGRYMISIEKAQELLNNMKEGVAEGEKDTSWMNKQSQDFYNKSPHFKRDDREVKSLGNNRLATKVSPIGGVPKVSKKPITSFNSESTVGSSTTVDSLVTDALKIMQGPEFSDAELAVKKVLGNRAYNERRSYYSFFINQLVDMYGKPEGSKTVDSLVTNSLAVMRGPSRDDAIAALKTTLGNEEYKSRSTFYKLWINQAVDKYSQQGVTEAKGLAKKVKVVKGEHAGKTGWIREIKHGAFKGAPKTYYIDLDDGSQANNLPATSLRLVKDVDEGLSADVRDYFANPKNDMAEPYRRKTPTPPHDIQMIMWRIKQHQPVSKSDQQRVANWAHQAVAVRKIYADVNEEEVQEAEVRHDRYVRSHGKQASGGHGSWMFTNKEYGEPGKDEVFIAPPGKFGDAAKHAKQWAKEKGHRTVYAMEADVGEGVIYQLDKENPMSGTEVLVIGGAGRYSLDGLRAKARKEVAELAKDLEIEHGGAFRRSAHNVKQLQNTLNTIVAAYDELNQIRKLGGLRSKGIKDEDATVVREGVAVMEKWTQKYKNSINCSNPKGFSQRAHCAGKKK